MHGVSPHMHVLLAVALLGACAAHEIHRPRHQVSEREAHEATAAEREARRLIATDPWACMPPSTHPIDLPLPDENWLDRYVIVGDRCLHLTRADPGPCGTIHPCFTWGTAATCEAAISLCARR
jgi:hypothetical protein